MVDQPGSSNDEEHSDRTVLTDRDEIRRWADENDLIPVTSDRPEGGSRTELVQRDDVRSDHEEREWDAFFDKFEERNLALAYTEAGGSGEHRFVDRTEVVDEHGEMVDSVEKELLEGETVETEVTEREVVETEVVEEATIESELVDTEVIDTEVVDTEIVSEELVGVAMVETADAEVVDEDGRAYFGDDDQVIEIEESGSVVLEIDETRIETEEQIEKKIIESRVVDRDVDEETRVEDESLDIDIDAAGVHEHIGKSNLVNTRSDGVIDEQYIETEFDENNTATSTLTEHRTIENVVDERKELLAEITDVEIEGAEVVSGEVIETDIVESDMAAVTGHQLDVDTTQTSTESAERTEGAGGDVRSTGTDVGEDRPSGGRDTGVDVGVQITDRAMGRTVETPDGEEIGIVSGVDEDEGVFYVDRDPSATDKIKAHLHWGDDEDASVLTADQIDEIRHDAVIVKGREGTK